MTPIDLKTALARAITIAGEAQDEWDKAPAGMRAGKILIALAGGCPGYRIDIDEIHAALAHASAIEPVICPDCKGERRVPGQHGLCRRCRGGAQISRGSLRPGEVAPFEVPAASA